MKVIRLIEWEQDEAQILCDAMQGHASSLGEDADGKQTVGRHLRRIQAASGEPYSAQDIVDLHNVLTELEDLWLPQSDPRWWRERGAPGADDAIAGLARERAEALKCVAAARSVVLEALGMVQEPSLESARRA